MSSCWKDNPQDRPTFQTLSMRFDEFIIQADSIYQNEIYTELWWLGYFLYHLYRIVKSFRCYLTGKYNKVMTVQDVNALFIRKRDRQIRIVCSSQCARRTSEPFNVSLDSFRIVCPEIFRWNLENGGLASILNTTRGISLRPKRSRTNRLGRYSYTMSKTICRRPLPRKQSDMRYSWVCFDELFSSCHVIET
jgi:hypothetical protein